MATPQTSSPPIFIHSLWRSGSTWLFDRFRRAQGPERYWCYQEPFHESLIYLQDQPETLLNFHYETSRSLRHPDLDRPYFQEFYEIKEHIAEYFQKCISYDSFFDVDICPTFDAYLSALIHHAQATPVLQCCRSFGRISQIKSRHGGVHIHLWRNPWDQWWSYQINDYFDTACLAVLNAVRGAAVIKLIRDELGFMEVHDSCFDEEFRQFLEFPMTAEKRYLLFYALWLYSFIECRTHADCDISIDLLSYGSEYKKTLENRFLSLGVTGIDFAGCDVPRTAFGSPDQDFFVPIEQHVQQLFAMSGYDIATIQNVSEIREELSGKLSDYHGKNIDAGVRARSAAYRYANRYSQVRVDNASMKHRLMQAYKELQESQNKNAEFHLREKDHGEREQVALAREREYTDQIAAVHAQHEQILAELNATHQAACEAKWLERTQSAQRALDDTRSQAQAREAELRAQAQAELAAVQHGLKQELEHLRNTQQADHQAALSREREYTDQIAAVYARHEQALVAFNTAHQVHEAEWLERIQSAQRALDDTRSQAQAQETELRKEFNNSIETMVTQVHAEANAQVQIYERLIAQLHSQESTLRNELAQHAAYAHELATRIIAMHSTWWWRLSMLFRRASHWKDFPGDPFLAQVQANPVHGVDPLMDQTHTSATSDNAFESSEANKEI